MKKNGKFKAIICSTLAGMMIGGLTVVGANQAIQAIQNTQIKVSLNGKIQQFKDETTGETQYPLTYHDRTYLPLRNVAQLSGLDVDYDANTNTAILTNSNNTSSTNSTEKRDWKMDYSYIIGIVSDKGEYYDAETKFGFAYINNDDVPELIVKFDSISTLIFSYDTQADHVYLLDIMTSGARGATGTQYVERENVIIEQSSGMLFESEYSKVAGAVGGYASWGSAKHLDTGKEETWSNNVYVLDENDDSKDVVESNITPQIQQYLDNAKEFDLKYNKQEAKEATYKL